MTTYQKIAALIFRITALGMVFFALLQPGVSFYVMGVIFWMPTLIYLVAGVALFAVAIPLSKIATIGFRG